MAKVVPVSLPRVVSVEELRREVEVSMNRIVGQLSSDKLRDRLNANRNRIYNLPEPSADDEPATKGYVDGRTGVGDEGPIAARLYGTGGTSPGEPAISPPPQPSGAEWSVVVAEYGRDDFTGENLARLEATVTVNPTEVLYYSIYSYTGAAPPADPNEYVDVCDTKKALTGSTTLTWWVTRQATTTTYQLVCVASSAKYTMMPDESDVPKELEVDPITYPDQVTDWVVTVITGDPGGIPSGRLQYDFTRDPGDLEYFCINIDRIACDGTYTPLVGAEWKPVGSVVDPWQQEEWWPRDDYDQYWIFRAQSTARSGLRNTTASPTYNVFVPASTGVTGGAATAPPQPASGDWSVSVAEYGRRDQTGENIARIQTTATTLDAEVSYVSVFIAPDASGKPADPASYKDVGTNETKISAGSTILNYWITRQDTAKTYWVILTASSERYHTSPTLTHVTTAKSITVNAVSVPAQPTYFSVSVLYESKGGVPGGRLNYAITKPSDPEYYTTEIERIACDNTFTPLGGASYQIVGSAVESVEAPDWWARPTSTEYWIFRATAVSRAFDATGARVKNTTARPTSALTVLASTGLDITNATTPGVQAVLNNVANYPTDKRPVIVVSGLPILPSASYPIGSLVFNTVDGKVYRNVSNVWTKGTDPQDLIAGTIAAGVVYAGTISADSLTAGTATVGSGGITFTGTGGIIIAGSGSVNVLAGAVNAWAAGIKSAGSGWDITGGLTPLITPAGFYGSNARINSYGYQIGGTEVINSSRALTNLTGVSATGYIDASGSGGFRCGADIGLGVGSTYSFQVLTPSGTKTIYIRGGIIFAVL